METHSPDIPVNLERVAELDRLGDEIAEPSAHLEAATARLLDLIREFDARGGWNTGFRSCAHWLSAWGSTWGPPGRRSGWRAPSGHCRSWPRPSRAGSSRMPRSGP